MAFPPRDADGGAVGHGDGSNDETTVLPPVDGDPALVRPYVRAAEPEAPAEDEQAAWTPAAPDPTATTATTDPAATTVLPPVPAPLPAAAPATGPVRVPAPAAAPLGHPQARRSAPSAAPKRGRVLALTGGALALILLGTGAALLTRPTGTPQAVASSTSTADTSGGSPSTSSSPSPSATPSHSPRPSATPSSHPSASHRASPKASHSAASPSPSANGAANSLGPGSTGPAVAQLQQDLRDLHVDRSLKPTGVYDQQTAQDVISFQACENVTGDPAGVYGPATRAAMQNALQNGLSC